MPSRRRTGKTNAPPKTNCEDEFHEDELRPEDEVRSEDEFPEDEFRRRIPRRRIAPPKMKDEFPLI